ncbi:MAG: cyclic pyranopterin monophosphate synthase MoaC [Nitriliruptoraceae bacterium]
MNLPSSSEPGKAGNELTHLDSDGHVHMVDVGHKQVTLRTAEAQARVLMAPATARRLMDGQLPKGDALALTRIAGIQAAKRTSELIPLCHLIALTAVTLDIAIDVDVGQITLTAQVQAHNRTGVEMEALTAVSVAALTLYDLTKAVQRDVVITDVRVTRKSGGQSGDFNAP